MAEHDSDPLHDVEAALTVAQNERTTARDALKEAWSAKPRELKAVLKACGKLVSKKWKVAAKAAVLNLKAISILLKTVFEVCKNLPFPTAGLSVTSFVVGGNLHQAAFSSLEWRQYLQGGALSDIVFPIPRNDLGIILIGSIVVAVLLAVLICLPIPWYAERLAGFFRWAFKSTSLKAVLSIGFVILSVLLSAGGVSPSVPKEISKDKVAIETVPPSEVNGEYLRVNENSTYMFVQSLDPNDTSVERVPVSQIAYITVNDGEREPGPASAVHELLKRNEKEHEALRHGHDAYALADHNHKAVDPGDHEHPIYAPKDHKHPVPSHKHDTYAVKDHGHSYAAVDHKHGGPNPDHEHPNYITEDLLRTRINTEMACDGGKEAQISGFIRFNKGSAKLGDFDANSEEIKSFANKRGQATKWVVFGFASPDGEQGVNNPLSNERATIVRKELCTALSSSRPELKCEEDINIKKAGEDYPINGVANSRSARIAVCVNDAPQQS